MMAGQHIDFELHGAVWRGAADTLQEIASALKAGAEWQSYCPMAAVASLACFIADGYETLAGGPPLDATVQPKSATEESIMITEEQDAAVETVRQTLRNAAWHLKGKARRDPAERELVEQIDEAIRLINAIFPGTR